ncbi:MAG: C4-dicarboxylate ABC transporter [Proteobacteria bacterium]|nr:MAG: C4-dicarboxylate ABC transporter [Pseudomonadota bacterium]
MNQVAATDPTRKHEHLPRLAHLPIAFFSIIMGLAGLTLGWDKAAVILGKPLYIGDILAIVTPIVFLVVATLYLSKRLKYPQAVKADLGHPIKLAFFPAISISLLLIATTLVHRLPAIAEVIWMVGAALHLVLTLYVISSWMHHPHYKVQHMSPAWFIPAVGNVLVPVAGVALGYSHISWFFFSIGMMFWVILFTIVFYRVLFHDPLPARMIPTFFILIAPPAVGFIAYTRLAENFDSFSHFLYYAALFLTLLLFVQVRMFTRLQFFLSWWAYSFPLAAMTLATFLMYEIDGSAFFMYLGFSLLIILTAVIVLLLVKTLNAIRQKAICVED